MFNTIAPVANFILQFLNILPQPVYAFIVLPLSFFALVSTFRLLWSLH